MFNPYQRACAAAFGGGDFAHVVTMDDVRGVHDTLFTFLMVELSSDEGCLDQEIAIRRLATAAADIDGVMDAILGPAPTGDAA